ERVRALEDHPDAAAHGDRVDARPLEVDPVVDDLAVRAEAGHEVVHPVQAADEGALPAARRADDGGDEVRVDLHGDVAYGGVRAVPGRELADVEDHLPPIALGYGGLGRAEPRRVEPGHRGCGLAVGLAALGRLANLVLLHGARSVLDFHEASPLALET